MTIINTYVAFDGTKFDDEFDCLDYEFTLQMYDINGYSDVHRIIVADEKDLEDIKHVYEYSGIYIGVNSIGTWVYDEDEDNWILRSDKK